MRRREELIRILDFILNKADADELNVIREAMERRAKNLMSPMGQLNIPKMAESFTKAMEAQMGSVKNIHEIAQKFVKDMIINMIPEIPKEHLEVLLKNWVPDPEYRSKQTEESLPKGIVKSMIVQFIDYSLGRMSEKNKQELTPGWSERYWSIFSINTRNLITAFLKGNISEEEFWSGIEGRDSGEEET
jgi:hypothetical protein